MPKKRSGYNQIFYSYTYPKEKILWATTKIFSHSSKGKTTPGYALKIYPLTFSAEKSGVLFLEKQEIYKMFKTAGLSVKRKQAKDGEILCLLQCVYYISDILYTDQTVFLAVVLI